MAIEVPRDRDGSFEPKLVAESTDWARTLALLGRDPHWTGQYTQNPVG